MPGHSPTSPVPVVTQLEILANRAGEICSGFDRIARYSQSPSVTLIETATTLVSLMVDFTGDLNTLRWAAREGDTSKKLEPAVIQPLLTLIDEAVSLLQSRIDEQAKPIGNLDIAVAQNLGKVIAAWVALPPESTAEMQETLAAAMTDARCWLSD